MKVTKASLPIIIEPDTNHHGYYAEAFLNSMKLIEVMISSAKK
jgi:hypothetical protein